MSNVRNRQDPAASRSSSSSSSLQGFGSGWALEPSSFQSDRNDENMLHGQNVTSSSRKIRGITYEDPIAVDDSLRSSINSGDRSGNDDRDRPRASKSRKLSDASEGTQDCVDSRFVKCLREKVPWTEDPKGGDIYRHNLNRLFSALQNSSAGNPHMRLLSFAAWCEANVTEPRPGPVQIEAAYSFYCEHRLLNLSRLFLHVYNVEISAHTGRDWDTLGVSLGAHDESSSTGPVEGCARETRKPSDVTESTSRLSSDSGPGPDPLRVNAQGSDIVFDVTLGNPPSGGASCAGAKTTEVSATGDERAKILKGIGCSTYLGRIMTSNAAPGRLVIVCRRTKKGNTFALCLKSKISNSEFVQKFTENETESALARIHAFVSEHEDHYDDSSVATIVYDLRAGTTPKARCASVLARAFGLAGRGGTRNLARKLSLQFGDNISSEVKDRYEGRPGQLLDPNGNVIFSVQNDHTAGIRSTVVFTRELVYKAFGAVNKLPFSDAIQLLDVLYDVANLFTQACLARENYARIVFQHGLGQARQDFSDIEQNIGTKGTVTMFGFDDGMTSIHPYPPWRVLNLKAVRVGFEYLSQAAFAKLNDAGMRAKFGQILCGFAESMREAATRCKEAERRSMRAHGNLIAGPPPPSLQRTLLLASLSLLPNKALRLNSDSAARVAAGLVNQLNKENCDEETRTLVEDALCDCCSSFGEEMSTNYVISMLMQAELPARHGDIEDEKEHRTAKLWACIFKAAEKSEVALRFAYERKKDTDLGKVVNCLRVNMSGCVLPYIQDLLSLHSHDTAFVAELEQARSCFLQKSRSTEAFEFNEQAVLVLANRLKQLLDLQDELFSGSAWDREHPSLTFEDYHDHFEMNGGQCPSCGKSFSRELWLNWTSLPVCESCAQDESFADDLCEKIEEARRSLHAANTIFDECLRRTMCKGALQVLQERAEKARINLENAQTEHDAVEQLLEELSSIRKESANGNSDLMSVEDDDPQCTICLEQFPRGMWSEWPTPPAPREGCCASCAHGGQIDDLRSTLADVAALVFSLRGEAERAQRSLDNYMNRANNDVALAHALDKYQELANSSSVSPAAIDAALRVLIGVVDRTFSDKAILAAKVLLEECLSAESEDVTAIAGAIKRFLGAVERVRSEKALEEARRLLRVELEAAEEGALTGALNRYMGMLNKSECASVLDRIQELREIVSENFSPSKRRRLNKQLDDIEKAFSHRSTSTVNLVHLRSKAKALDATFEDFKTLYKIADRAMKQQGGHYGNTEAAKAFLDAALKFPLHKLVDRMVQVANSGVCLLELTCVLSGRDAERTWFLRSPDTEEDLPSLVNAQQMLADVDKSERLQHLARLFCAICCGLEKHSRTGQCQHSMDRFLALSEAETDVTDEAKADVREARDRFKILNSKLVNTDKVPIASCLIHAAANAPDELPQDTPWAMRAARGIPNIMDQVRSNDWWEKTHGGTVPACFRSVLNLFEVEAPEQPAQAWSDKRKWYVLVAIELLEMVHDLCCGEEGRHPTAMERLVKSLDYVVACAAAIEQQKSAAAAAVHLSSSAAASESKSSSSEHNTWSKTEQEAKAIDSIVSATRLTFGGGGEPPPLDVVQARLLVAVQWARFLLARHQGVTDLPEDSPLQTRHGLEKYAQWYADANFDSTGRLPSLLRRALFSNAYMPEHPWGEFGGFADNEFGRQVAQVKARWHSMFQNHNRKMSVGRVTRIAADAFSRVRDKQRFLVKLTESVNEEVERLVAEAGNGKKRKGKKRVNGAKTFRAANILRPGVADVILLAHESWLRGDPSLPNLSVLEVALGPDGGGDEASGSDSIRYTARCFARLSDVHGRAPTKVYKLPPSAWTVRKQLSCLLAASVWLARLRKVDWFSENSELQLAAECMSEALTYALVEFTGFGAYALLQEVGRFVYELRRLCNGSEMQPFEGCPSQVKSWVIFVSVQGKVQQSETLLKIAARARELRMRDVMDKDCLPQIDGSHKFLTDEREDPGNAFLPRRGTLPRLDNDLNKRLVRALGKKRLAAARIQARNLEKLTRNEMKQKAKSKQKKRKRKQKPDNVAATAQNKKQKHGSIQALLAAAATPSKRTNEDGGGGSSSSSSSSSKKEPEVHEVHDLTQ